MMKNTLVFWLAALLIAVSVSKAYFFYLSQLGFEDIEIVEQGFGVNDPIFVIKTSILVFTSNILFWSAIKKKSLHSNGLNLPALISLDYLHILLKTLSRVCIVSLALLLFSLGLSYRFCYLVYVAAPICYIISYSSAFYIFKKITPIHD
jgi:hypothetical protein